jgi:ADP-heptose:LPS heptosyltransferase
MGARPHLAIQLPSLLLLAGLLKRCALVIGNDGGTMHLASAVGTRTVSLFGPVDSSVYGPYPPRPIHRVVSLGLACRPCYRSFRFPPCPWDNRCLKELPVEQVLEAANALLA